MSTPTLKELCAKATKGPRIHIKWESIIWTRLNDGCRGSHIARVPDENAPRCIADAQLIARLSPEVMVKVYEALTLVDLAFTRMNYGNPELMGDDEFEAWKAVKKSLRLLDGKPEATP